MKKIIYLLMLLILVQIAYSATIHGTIYDLTLNKVDNVVVEVNSTPQQRFISKDGAYSFSLNPGYYEITADYIDGARYSAKEKLQITEEGTYVIDLFLFPSFADENELTADTEIDVDEDVFETAKSSYLYLIVILILLILVFLIFKFKKRKKPKEEKKEQEKEIAEEKKDLKEVLEIIKKQGGRATQKEIRKQIPLSEAKISLMISELEHQGKIRKIKKGRGNILILND